MGKNLRFMCPKTLAPPPGYSYVVESTGPSRTYYIAGQLGLDLENRLVGPDFRSQAVQAFENLGRALDAVGATFADVVKINNYLTDIAGDIGAFREVRDRFLNTRAPPASTTVGVPALARPGAVFEIEAIAVLPGKAAQAAAKAPAKRSAGKSAKRSTKKKKKR